MQEIDSFFKKVKCVCMYIYIYICIYIYIYMLVGGLEKDYVGGVQFKIDWGKK